MKIVMKITAQEDLKEVKRILLSYISMTLRSLSCSGARDVTLENIERTIKEYPKDTDERTDLQDCKKAFLIMKQW